MAHRDQFLIGTDVCFRGQAEVGRAAEPAASVENDPSRPFDARLRCNAAREVMRWITAGQGRQRLGARHVAFGSWIAACDISTKIYLAIWPRRAPSETNANSVRRQLPTKRRFTEVPAPLSAALSFRSTDAIGRQAIKIKRHSVRVPSSTAFGTFALLAASVLILA